MVQGTINGYGERCGNVDLISVIGNLQLKMSCEFCQGKIF
jgi:2-isopropylmalate synthase